MICILYVFVNSKYYILEVPNWYLMAIFDVVANCDQLACAFDIAICEIIHLTQNKKPILFENRLKFNPKVFVKISSPTGICPTIPEKQRDDNLIGAFFVPRGFLYNTGYQRCFMWWAKSMR